MAKSADEIEKGTYLCAQCSSEFKGKKCPECGNMEGNSLLAADGIDQRLHRKGAVFGRIDDIKSRETLMDTDQKMMERAAEAQLNEMNANLRDSFVLKSEIKKTDLELLRLQKQSELDATKKALESGKPAPRNPYQNPAVQQGQPGPENGMWSGPLIQNNPQTSVMTYLMKMKKEDRQQFLDQLAEADPQAIATLSSLVAPAPQQQFQQYPGMSPWGMMPPWMYPAQQPSSNGNSGGGSPIELAVEIIKAIKELMPSGKGDSDAVQIYKDEIKDLRQEIKEIRNQGSKVDIPQLAELKDEVSSLRGQLASGGGVGGIAQQVTQIKELVTGLEEIGLINKTSVSGETVDDKLKIRQFDHQVKMEEDKLKLEQDRLAAEKERTNLSKGLMTAVFQRKIAPRTDVKDEPAKKVVMTSSRPASVSRPSVVVQEDRPPEIVAEYPVEGARVFESRSPVKRSQVQTEG